MTSLQPHGVRKRNQRSAQETESAEAGVSPVSGGPSLKQSSLFTAGIQCDLNPPEGTETPCAFPSEVLARPFPFPRVLQWSEQEVQPCSRPLPVRACTEHARRLKQGTEEGRSAGAA